MKTVRKSRRIVVMIACIGSTLFAFSCTKNDYGIAPYKRPSSLPQDSTKKSIFDDTTRLKLITNVGNWDANVSAYEDLQYDKYLTRYSGWNGGDGNYSHLLSDSTILWTFQDSFIGVVDNTRNRPPDQNVFVRNAGILQKKGDMNSFIQLNLGSLNNSQTWIQYDNLPSNDTKEIYWPGGGHVVNGTFQVLLAHSSYNTSGGLDFSSVDLGIFSLPDMTLQKVIKNKYVGIMNFDSNIYDDADGYTYIYGNEGAYLSNKLHVARVANHDLSGNWQFLTNSGWSDTPDSYFIIQDSQTLPNVIKDGSTYYLISQEWGYGRNIFIWSGSTPAGPFTNRRTIYQIPDNSKVVTYNMTVHTALSEEGELVIAYNNNPKSFADNFNATGSADLYRPYFVRLRNWK